MSLHTLKVTLQYLGPAVWRRLEVPSAFTLAELSAVLQVAFGWSGEHLHGFVAGRRSIDEEATATLGWIAPSPGDVVGYTYDFGDDWQHAIVVEGVHPAAADQVYPVCTGGEGLPPEEDTGRPRPGRFDNLERRDINDTLASGRSRPRRRDLPGRGDAADPAFAGLFPELLPEPGVCSCGCHHDEHAALSQMLPVYEPVPNDVLAEEAARSPLVRQAVALATWLGSGHPVTAGGVLELADAETAVDELGLDEMVLPDEDEEDEDEFDGGGPPDPFDGADDLDDAVDLDEDDELEPRSAAELPSLHALWTAALAGQLIDVRDGMAYPGAGLEVWRGEASPTDRIEAWARLTAAYLRTWAEDDADSMLATTAPLLYATAQRPVRAGVLAAGILDLHEDDDESQLLGLPSLVDDVGLALEDWAVCGVVAEAPADQESPDGALEGPAGAMSELAAQLRDQVSKAAASGEDAALGLALTTIIDALVQGPQVQLTPLGRYGLTRLLAAHRFKVPNAGDCVDVEPARLLDRLVMYLPQDALNEARRWVEARGDEWEFALREVAATAAVKGTEGPPRRSVLQAVLCAAGERVAPLLDSLDDDEWLAVPAAVARHRLGIGPDPTLAQRMWAVVDGLTLVIDDEDEFEDAVHDLRLCELLRRPGAMTAAAEVSHPRAREVLMISARYLGDAETARQLRRALDNNVRQRPVRRATSGGRRSRKRR